MSFFSIIVCALYAVLLGSLWYSPLLFGKQWMEATGVSGEHHQKHSMKRMYFFTALVFLVIAGLLKYLFGLLFVASTLEALGLVLIIWLGFSALMTATEYMYGRRGWNIFFIDQGYRLAFLIGSAVILTSFI